MLPPIAAFVYALMFGVPDRQLPFHTAATLAGGLTFTVGVVLAKPSASIALARRTDEHGLVDALYWPWCAWVVGILQLIPAFAILRTIIWIVAPDFDRAEQRNAYLGIAVLLSVPMGLLGTMLLLRSRVECAVQRYVREFPASEHIPTPAERDQARTLRLLEDYEAGDLAAADDLAERLVRGIGVPADKERGIAICQAAAERGQVNAQLTLSSWYREGDVLPLNDDKAYFWAYLACHRFPDLRGTLEEAGRSLSTQRREAVTRRALQWIELSADDPAEQPPRPLS